MTATTGHVTMADGTLYTAGGGAVTVLAAGNVVLGQIANPTGTVNVTATAGAITEVKSGEGAGNENITGTTLTLAA
ncbi:hypothetical protein EBR16_01585, partial [bacterium]|nr:hypothetical protein [bacterium]